LVGGDVADPGQHPLVQQRLGERPVRVRGQLGGGQAGVPVLAEQIGSQVRDRFRVAVALQDLQDAQVHADGTHAAGFQDDPRAVVDPDRPLAETLLDQRVLAGIGNVYANELCFVSGHLPSAPVSAVGDPHRLVSRARDMLWLNRFRWNRCTTGDTRTGRQLWVYGRAGQRCRRCGTRIDYDGSGDRVTYWCPSCQR
ncbi:zinc finger domain-containing protein, partial [Mycobacterium malmoense]|uniref:zinc finger domain-containing protein n=1 Tax=Mycobacterium malmoense TaxID=1780 RepID=UPI000ADE66EC